MRTRVRVFWRALRGRPFVLVGDAGDSSLNPPLPQTPTRPGTVVFEPEFSDEWPLWSAATHGGTAGRAQMPLPDALKQRVDDWARRWNQVMYDNFYGWPEDKTVRAALDQEARTLVSEMQATLGPEWHVEYGGIDA